MTDLKTRLSLAAESWCAAHADENGVPAPASRLARAAGYDDGQFFKNLPSSKRGPSTDTLEKFARFLVNPANWPEGKVADEAKALGHVPVVSVPAPTASAGLSSQTSSQAERAA